MPAKVMRCLDPAEQKEKLPCQMPFIKDPILSKLV